MKFFFFLTFFVISCILFESCASNNSHALQNKVDSLQTVITQLQKWQTEFVSVDSPAFKQAIKDTSGFIAAVTIPSYYIRNIGSYFKNGSVCLIIASDKTRRRYLLASSNNGNVGSNKIKINNSVQAMLGTIRIGDQFAKHDTSENCYPPSPSCPAFNGMTPYTHQK